MHIKIMGELNGCVLRWFSSIFLLIWSISQTLKVDTRPFVYVYRCWMWVTLYAGTVTVHMETNDDETEVMNESWPGLMRLSLGLWSPVSILRMIPYHKKIFGNVLLPRPLFPFSCTSMTSVILHLKENRETLPCHYVCVCVIALPRCRVFPTKCSSVCVTHVIVSFLDSMEPISREISYRNDGFTQDHNVFDGTISCREIHIVTYPL